MYLPYKHWPHCFYCLNYLSSIWNKGKILMQTLLEERVEIMRRNLFVFLPVEHRTCNRVLVPPPPHYPPKKHLEVFLQACLPREQPLNLSVCFYLKIWTCSTGLETGCKPVLFYFYKSLSNHCSSLQDYTPACSLSSILYQESRASMYAQNWNILNDYHFYFLGSNISCRIFTSVCFHFILR